MKKQIKNNFTADLVDQPEELVKYLDLALEGASLGIWDWYLTDNSVKFDRRWAEMLGLNYDEIKMELNTWESRVHPDDLDKAYADIKAYMDGKTDRYENIHRMKHADGHWVYILDRGRFSDWDADGKPIRFTGTHFDITHSENYKNKLSLFFENSPFGYAFCDMNGKLLEINTTYSKITGYTLEELDKLSYWDITPKKYEQDEAKQLESLKETGRYGPYRKEYLRKDGTLVPVELNGFIIEDYDGIKGIWSTVEDISEKKHLESQLIHSSKLASVGILAAGVAHEINNPLAIIKALTEKMSWKYPDDENLGHIAGRIDNAVARIAKIVMGLKTFSKLDGKEIKVLNANTALTESINMLEDIYQKDGLEIEFNSSGSEKLLVSGNKGHLQQVFVNLISNAKDATHNSPNAKVIIDLKEDNGFVVIKFTDNGRGIPHENIDRVFDPFFTTKGVNEGTGIGLSIAYNIVKEHNGEISVTSLEGKGSTFTIRLPKAKVTTIDEHQPIQNGASSIQDTNNMLSGNILLVDDEIEFRELMAESLTRMGLQVTEKENGEQAFEEFVRNPEHYDAIVSDIKMPEMDGQELFEKIREQKNIHQPKFIFITGGVNAEQDSSLEESLKKADGFFSKPFKANEIFNKLSSILSKAEAVKKMA